MSVNEITNLAAVFDRIRTERTTTDQKIRTLLAALDRLERSLDERSRGTGDEAAIESAVQTVVEHLEALDHLAYYPQTIDAIVDFERPEDLTDELEALVESDRGAVYLVFVALLVRLVERFDVGSWTDEEQEVVQQLVALYMLPVVPPTTFGSDLKAFAARLEAVSESDVLKFADLYDDWIEDTDMAEGPRVDEESLGEYIEAGHDAIGTHVYDPFLNGIDSLYDVAADAQSVNDLRGRWLESLRGRLCEQYPDTEALGEDLPWLNDRLNEVDPETTGKLPVLFLPIRLQTRFLVDDNPETPDMEWKLAVRVYPDDIHSDTHEPELTATEIDWGTYFWKAIWWTWLPAGPLIDPDPAVVASQEGLDGLDPASLPMEPAARHAIVKERVWNQLVERYGRERAAWVKHRLRPPTAEQLLTGPHEDDSEYTVPPRPDFDSIAAEIPEAPASWTRQPIASLLPDRWVAFAEIEGEVVTAYGQPISESLSIGPDPGVFGPSTDTEDGDDSGSDEVLHGFGPGTEWLVDFSAALDVGMGIEVSLTQDQVDAGVDRLVVFGVSTTMGGTDSAMAVRRLLDSHHYTGGFSFLPQGTPTNHTAESSAAAPDCGTSSVETECDAPLVPRDGAIRTDDDPVDGSLVAHALGIEPTMLGDDADDHVFAHVANADRTEQTDARHLQTALWSAMLGYYVPHMLLPESIRTESEQARPGFLSWLDAYRDHFIEYVRARGPLPAVRVGDQPYGLLPVLDLSAWEHLPMTGDDPPLTDFQKETRRNDDIFPRRLYPPGTETFENDLVTRIRQLKDVWEQSLEHVPALESSEDADKTLVDFLQMEAHAYGYRVRGLIGRLGMAALRTDRSLSTLEESLWDDLREEDEVIDLLLEKIAQLESESVEQLEKARTSSATVDPPRIANLSFEDDEEWRTALLTFAPELGTIDPLVTDSTKSFIQRLLDLAVDGESGLASMEELRAGPPMRPTAQQLQELEQAYFGQLAPGLALPPHEFGRGATAIELLLYYALLQEYVLARVRVGHLYPDPDLRELNLPDPAWSLIPEPELHFESSSTLWRRLSDRLPSGVDPSETSLLERRSTPFTHGDTYWTALTKVPELDHSLDQSLDSLQWLQLVDSTDLEQLLLETLDLASHRYDAWATSVATRQLNRLREDAGVVGLAIGGYGFVENLSPRDPDDQSFGYIHTPSVQQATTAAVLRSGHLSHSDDELGELLAVDLSADRVRSAKRVIDAVGNGQHLGTLLGYQFERGLHERHDDVELDRYVPVFRRLSPLTVGKQSRERVANDGSDDPDATAATDERVAVRDGLDGLALYRMWSNGELGWGGTGDNALPAVGSAEHTAIVREFERLATLVDAIEDLLTAESVHQLVNGNPERSGASLDALARGEVPPELEVTATPRSGRTATHRLLVLFDDTPTDTGNPDSPRARAGPSLESWVGQLLGDFDRVCCIVVAAPTGEDGEADDGDPIYTVVRLSDLGLSALDVLAVVQGDTEAHRSELEGRIHYHVRRKEYDLVGDRPLSLWFDPISTWTDQLAGTETSLAELGVDPARDLSFGEFLAVVMDVQRLITGCRAASAADLQVPEDTEDDAFDAVGLRVRADAIRADLSAVQVRLDGLIHALHPTEETGSNCVRILESELNEFQPTDIGSTADLAGEIQLEGLLDTVESWLQRRKVNRLDPLLDDIESLVRSYPKLPRGGEKRKAEADITQLREGLSDFAEWLRQYRFGRPNPTRKNLLKLIQKTEDKLSEMRKRLVNPYGERTMWPYGERTRWKTDLERLAELSERMRELWITFQGRNRGGFGNRNRDRDDRRTFVPPESVSRLVRLYRALDTIETARAEFETSIQDVKADHLQVARDIIASMDGTTPAAIDRIDLLLDSLDPGFLMTVEGTMDQLSFLTREVNESGGTSDDRLYPGTVEQLEELVEQHSTATDRETFEQTIEQSLQALELELRRLGGILSTLGSLVETFENAGMDGLRQVLLEASPFGVYGSVPLSAQGNSPADIAELTAQAASIAAELDERHARTDPDEPSVGTQPTQPTADAEIKRLHALLGESFVVLPPFTVSATDLFEKTPEPDHLAVETWFHRISRIREKPRLLGHVLTVGETLNGPLATRFTVEQLPHRPNERWIGGPEAWTGQPPEGERMSIVAHTPPGVDPTKNVLTGLFIDEWVETIPNDHETTGISFHFDTPGTRPPQSLLVAVPPNNRPWTLVSLAETIREGLDLAKLRLVDPTALERTGHLLPGLCFAENQTGGSLDSDAPSVSFDHLESWSLR